MTDPIVITQTAALYTLRQAAVLVGVTPDSLRQRIHRGTLKGWKFGPVWVLPAEEVARIAPPGSVPSLTDTLKSGQP